MAAIQHDREQGQPVTPVLSHHVPVSLFHCLLEELTVTKPKNLIRSEGRMPIPRKVV